jgi:hypothetical protein
MQKEMILGLSRHVLTAAGGYLLANGLADDSEVNEIVGALVTLLGAGWSIWAKVQAKKAAAVKVVAVLVMLGVIGAVAGCAGLKPGSDGLVVRTEQTQAIARSTFDLVLTADNINRSFWRTNAPAFHEFCEWLRNTNTVYHSPEFGATNIPRVLMLQFQVDDVKEAYRGARASSNELWVAWATLNSALLQAEQWKGVIFKK